MVKFKVSNAFRRKMVQTMEESQEVNKFEMDDILRREATLIEDKFGVEVEIQTKEKNFGIVWNYVNVYSSLRRELLFSVTSQRKDEFVGLNVIFETIEVKQDVLDYLGKIIGVFNRENDGDFLYSIEITDSEINVPELEELKYVGMQNQPSGSNKFYFTNSDEMVSKAREIDKLNSFMNEFKGKKYEEFILQKCKNLPYESMLNFVMNSEVSLEASYRGVVAGGIKYKGNNRILIFSMPQNLDFLMKDSESSPIGFMKEEIDVEQITSFEQLEGLLKKVFLDNKIGAVFAEPDYKKLLGLSSITKELEGLKEIFKTIASEMDLTKIELLNAILMDEIKAMPEDSGKSFHYEIRQKDDDLDTYKCETFVLSKEDNKLLYFATMRYTERTATEEKDVDVCELIGFYKEFDEHEISKTFLKKLLEKMN